MNRVRVGAAILNQTPLDWAGNQRNMVDAIHEARAQGVRVLCLPEMSISGYGCGAELQNGARERNCRGWPRSLPRTEERTPLPGSSAVSPPK